MSGKVKLHSVSYDIDCKKVGIIFEGNHLMNHYKKENIEKNDLPSFARDLLSINGVTEIILHAKDIEVCVGPFYEPANLLLETESIITHYFVKSGK